MLENGYKVLLLPQSVAMSAAECRRIVAFVEAGGTVVADNTVAAMDEHGRRLAHGQLDELFGVRQNLGWMPAGTGRTEGSAAGATRLITFDPHLSIAGERRLPAASMAVRKETGKGSAIYLNLDMHDYGKLRPAGANHRALFEQIFRSAGIGAPLQVRGAEGVKICHYSNAGVEYFPLLPNAAYDRSPGRPDAAARIQIRLPKAARVRDGYRNTDLGRRRDLEVVLPPATPVLLELRPER